MSKVYNTPFKIGFGFNLLVFAVLNVASYINAHYESADLNARFNSVIYPRWGFPTEIYTTEGAIIGGFIIGICGLISGLLFKSVWADISSRHPNIK